MSDLAPSAERREIWSDDPRAVRELVAGALAALLLTPPSDRPIYVSAPALADFPVFYNRFGEYSGLFPDIADEPEIRLGEVIRHLARRCAVRIISRQNERSSAFVEALIAGGGVATYALSADAFAEEGILSTVLYLEGGLDFDASGLRVRGEKVAYYPAASPQGRQRIASAYLEFDRRWKSLQGNK